MPQEISPFSKSDPYDELQFLGRCPICSVKYKPVNAQVLNEREDLTMAHVDCARCKSSVILAIMSTKMGLVTTMGMITDLTKQDIKRASSASVITTDDVIKLHKRLEQSSGK